MIIIKKSFYYIYENGGCSLSPFNKLKNNPLLFFFQTNKCYLLQTIIIKNDRRHFFFNINNNNNNLIYINPIPILLFPFYFK